MKQTKQVWLGGCGKDHYIGVRHIEFETPGPVHVVSILSFLQGGPLLGSIITELPLVPLKNSPEMMASAVMIPLAPLPPSPREGGGGGWGGEEKRGQFTPKRERPRLQDDPALCNVQLVPFSEATRGPSW